MDKKSFITLIITFLLVLLPYFVYIFWGDILKRRQNVSVIVKKCIDIILFFSLFYLQLFSFYKKRGIIDSIRYLSESVNIKFIILSCLLGFVILLVHIISKKKGVMFDIDFKRIPGYFIISLLVFFFLVNTLFMLVIGRKILMVVLLFPGTKLKESMIT